MEQVNKARYIELPVPHFRAIVDGLEADVYPTEVMETLLHYLDGQSCPTKEIAT